MMSQKKWGWREVCRDGLVVKSACWSCRRPGFGSQHLQSATTPLLWDPVPPFGLHGYLYPCLQPP